MCDTDFWIFEVMPVNLAIVLLLGIFIPGILIRLIYQG